MSALWHFLFLTATAQAFPGTLTGTVRDQAGQPVRGASIFISTAAPRKGAGVL